MIHWLTDPPINWSLLGNLMLVTGGLSFLLMLLGIGYTQTGIPAWYKRVISAYYFPMCLLGPWLDERPLPRWLRETLGLLVWVNALVNLTLVTLPFERLITRFF